MSSENKRERQEQKLSFEVGTVEEALAAASAQWEVPSEMLQAEVVGSERGFLGLFGKKLQVEVRPQRPLALMKGLTFLNELLERMGLASRAVIQDDETLDIEGPDAADVIVRRYGDCLKALEYLLNLALRDPSAEPRVRLDSCGFRERRARTLEKLARSTAREALELGRPIRLEPMLSWERWVIHMALKDRDDVRTESVGEPPMRKVVVMPKFDTSSGEGYRRRARFPRRR